jgi:hypothetical protein
MASIQDFANPRSMMTPGIAGAITMFVTNALGTQFDLPRNWVGLAISFLLGLVVFASSVAGVRERVALYVVNSLIIFATAFGTNSVGTQLTTNSAASESLASSAPAPAPSAAAATHLAVVRQQLATANDALTAARAQQAVVQAQAASEPHAVKHAAPPVTGANRPPATEAKAVPDEVSRHLAEATTAVNEAQNRSEQAELALQQVQTTESAAPAATEGAARPKAFFKTWQ